VIGFEQRRPEVALALEPAVRAAVLQAGNDLVQQAVLAKSMGLVEAARSNNPAARDHFLRARTLYVAARGEHHDDVTLADINIASVVMHLGQLDEAQRRLERALSQLDPGGAHNPTIAQVHQNLCAVAWRRDDWSGSERHCRAAAELYTSTLGADHPLTAKSLMFLGRALSKLGRFDEARIALERARAVQEKAMPPGQPERIHTGLYLAQIAEARRDFAGAEELALGALAALRQHGIPVARHAFALSELARIASHRSLARGLDYYDEALQAHVSNPGRDRSGDRELLVDMTKVALAANQPRRVLAWFAKLPDAAAALPDLRARLAAKRR
jgi:tetratricopeptide (TPR) repeat protein